MYSDSIDTVYGSFIREQQMKLKAKKIKRAKKIKKAQELKHHYSKQQSLDLDMQYIGPELDTELDNITSSWEI